MNEVSNSNTNNGNTVKVVVIVILTILLIASLSFIAYDKLIKKDNDTNVGENANDNTNENNSKVENDFDNSKYVGTYTVKYNANAGDIADNKESSLTLNDDDTFLFEWNACDGMIKTKGSYKVNEDKIVLSDFDSEYMDMVETNLNGQSSLNFNIVSENEIYLDRENDFACTISGNEYGSFVKK